MRWFALRPQRTTLAGGRLSSAPHRYWATPYLKGYPGYRVRVGLRLSEGWEVWGTQG